jgi:uncharacterized protein YbjT (DUF2867 family)
VTRETIVTSPILVTGGTGNLGRHVVPRLLDAGVPVRVLSRHPGTSGDGVEHVAGDLKTGAGVDSAVAGVATIMHLAGTSKGDAQMTQSLVRAAARAGSPHFLYISVVGAERIPVTSALDRMMFGYFAEKRAAEIAVERSGLPWTTLRATQFHDLVLMVARQLGKLPFVPIPKGMRFQPVDVDEVAARMVELALGQPAGLVPDIAGPRAYALEQLAGSYLRAAGRSRPIVRVPIPGRAARAVKDGAVLPIGGIVGHRTWEEFLAGQLPAVRS